MHNDDNILLTEFAVEHLMELELGLGVVKFNLDVFRHLYVRGCL
jgi:hypothetical protein